MSRFYYCEKCGNMFGILEDNHRPILCCGQEMVLVEPKVVEEGPYEKHIPDVKVEGDTIKVQVGSTVHPMVPEHYISWIYLETENGGQRKVCKGTPTAEFVVINDKPIAVWSFCNLHGLWKKDL
ncbi:MAG TPA: desulfoferrodoxin [Clostridiales bacterium]|nr:desulfoferrodoxin [Clostridiales bacterium]